jgi:hypothetical protein
VRSAILVTEKAGIMKLQKRVLPCPFRSLLVAVAGALLLTAVFAPQANATLIMYFNFEDAPNTGGRNAAFDDFADALPGTPGALDSDNTGGGIQFSKLTVVTTANVSTAGGLLDNRAPGDSDPANPVPPSFNGHALLFNSTKGTTAAVSFTVNTSFLTGLSLSFVSDNNGNGYGTAALTASVNGGAAFAVGGPPQTLLTGVNTITFNIGNGGGVFLGSGTLQSTVFTLTFTNPGNSNGQDRQTAIDNIRLEGTVVPEPATVAGGLLCVFGLFWHQCRRLVRSPRLQRA